MKIVTNKFKMGTPVVNPIISLYGSTEKIFKKLQHIAIKFHNIPGIFYYDVYVINPLYYGGDMSEQQLQGKEKLQKILDGPFIAGECQRPVFIIYLFTGKTKATLVQAAQETSVY